MTLRTLSLCSGVGGLDLAVGMTTPTELVAYADPDPDASRVMAHNFPGVPNLGDIKLVKWWDFKPRVDLITAGYPCQPFSLAGRRKGIDDPRHLYPYISEAISVLRPGLVFLENVPGHRNKGFGEVVHDLSEVGYRVAWTSVRASDVGAPHRRERVFILAADSHDDRVRAEQVSVERSSNPSVAQWCGSPTVPDSESTVGAAPQVAQLPGNGAPDVLDWHEYTAAIRRWEFVTGRLAPNPVGFGPRGGRRVSSQFGEWVMGFPAGWISDVHGITLQTAAKLYGNAVVPQQGAVAFAHLVSVLREYAEVPA